ncbi:hypothetical protein HHUSO_G1980 [Huso huso]|uniref:Metallothionein n=1 Tax=Huso huso TaxID=61971 RepID=A0ABR1A6B0_HUSHU
MNDKQACYMQSIQAALKSSTTVVITLEPQLSARSCDCSSVDCPDSCCACFEKQHTCTHQRELSTATSN